MCVQQQDYKGNFIHCDSLVVSSVSKLVYVNESLHFVEISLQLVSHDLTSMDTQTTRSGEKNFLLHPCGFCHMKKRGVDSRYGTKKKEVGKSKASCAFIHLWFQRGGDFPFTH